MKIESLHLTAFGPFSGESLDFSSATPGFNLVYGPNEAGKSSALRAIRALLYGIDERTPDNFVHPYNRMRIGGKLVSENGQILEITRRKGRTGTLRGKDDKTIIDEARLRWFLNNVDETMFSTMFGIGYDELVAGGKEIISGGGDLGQLIFSAGSGIVRLKQIREKIASEAENLFKPSGKVPSINAAISALKENETRMRQAMLAASQWIHLDRELRKTSEKRKSVETNLKDNEKKLHYFARVKQALPLIARRKELFASLGQYRDDPVLPKDFPETRRELVSKLEMADKEAVRAKKAIEQIKKEMAGLYPSDAMLENADLIESFHRQLGSQHKAEEDRIKLDTRRSTLLGECREIMRGLSKDLTIKEAHRLHISKQQAAAIRRLAAGYGQITARIENASDILPGLKEEISLLEEKKNDLPACADKQLIDKLGTAVEEALEYGPVEKQNIKALKEVEETKASVGRCLEKLGFSGKTARDLEKLQIPESETIQIFEEKFSRASLQVSQTDADMKKIQTKIRDLQAAIEARQMAQAIVTEEDLYEVRKTRDKGWQLIRHQLEGKNPDASSVSEYISSTGETENLLDVFESRVKAADQVSDRLRREADRVAENARLTADLKAAMDEEKNLVAEYEKAQINKTETEKQWAHLWSALPVEPATPREMERFAQNLHTLSQKLSETEVGLRRFLEEKQNIDTRKKNLARILNILLPGDDYLNEPLSRLISRTQKFLEQERLLALSYEKTDSELAARKKEYAAAVSKKKAGEKDLEIWKSKWAEAVCPIGLPADSGPEEADAVMEELRTLFEKLKEAEILEKRIAGIDRDAQGFAENVTGLAKAVAADLKGQQPQFIAIELNKRLTRSREARTRYQTLERHLLSENQNLSAAEETASEIRAKLDLMCQEAECADYRQLARAEQRSATRRNLEAELKSIEERILELSAGATVDEFATDASALDADTIEPEIAGRKETVAKLEEEKNRLAETTGSLRNELLRMNGSSEAAHMAEQRQQILGQMDADARHYARVKIAARLLDMAIDRFCEKNQDPMLIRASELFSEITCKAFKGVRPEFDNTGRPVITGIRSHDGEIVDVTAMSDGTADQLYLALRLAGLEMTIEKSRPMPFIVDDILIKFDNDRALAALKVLARLAERTQIIFFTHHDHLIELAENSIQKKNIIFHRLLS